ncbi:MAG: GNAT family N-acetyltransferase [Phycicoccus sp.]|nr:GNAT family N-acetyltransferase [Phycicoccus sp.]
MTELRWAALSEDDLPDLVGLAQACLDQDGGLPQLADERMLRRLFLSGAALGGREITGELGAAASTWVGEHASRQATGLVAPDLRGQGIGDQLILWVREQASGSPVRVIAETTSPELGALMARAGLTLTFAEAIMRHRRTRVPQIPLPAPLRVEAYGPDTATAFFAAYRASFLDRPGFPDPTFEEWVGALDEEDFLPAESRVALTADGEAVGFVTVSTGWIDQVGVVPAWRGRGLGAHLVVRSVTALRKQGPKAVWLAVNIDNPRARALYERIGFKSKGMRARYADRELVTPQH